MKISLIGEFEGKTIKIFLIIPMFLMIILLLLNLKRIKTRFVEDLKVLNPIKMSLFLPYEVKIRQKTDASVLDFYEFVKRNTPPEAVILIPPTAYPWPRTGNANYSRYFLYPRHLIVGKEKEPGIDLKKENVQYVLIVWGETKSVSSGYSFGWPKFFVPAKKIIYKSINDQFMNFDGVVIENKDFEKADFKNIKLGIIEIDRRRL